MQSCICELPARGSWTRNNLRGGALIEPLLPFEQPLLPLDRPKLPLDQPKLPMDLREWVSPWQIRTWIEQELSRLDWNNPRLVRYPQREPECEPRLMVCLLCFAYATQLFSSQEVAEASWSDGMLRAICNGRAPSAHAVRTFRRHNHSVLEPVLAGVFMRALTSRLDLDFSPFSSEIEWDLRDYAAKRAAKRIEIAWQVDLGED